MRFLLLRCLTSIALTTILCLGQNPSVGHGPVDKPSSSSNKRKTVAKKITPQTYDQLVSQAQKQIDAKEFSSAIKLLEQAESIAKNDFERHQAEDFLQHAKNKQQIAALTKTAREASKQGNHEAEIQTYEQALAIDRTDESTLKELVKALLADEERLANSGKADNAIQDYDKVANIYKDSSPDQVADIHDRITKLIWRDASSSFKARRYTVTRDRYKQLIERSPGDHNVMNEVAEHCLSDGRELYQNGQYNEAQLFADDALSYSTGSGDALQLQKRTQAQLDRQRGERLLTEDKTEEALKILRGASQWLSDDQDLAQEIAIAQARVEFAPAMIQLKGGRFRMGSDRGTLEEEPIHTVDVSPFLMGKYEITNAQYKQYCDDTHRDYPLNPPGWGSYFLEYPDHPVVNVTYADAVSYCEWLSQKTGQKFRLPTEAEWEYAARGDQASAKYEWGDYFSHRKANGRDFHEHRVTSAKAKTTSVGDFEANSFGLFDMTGNVAEWCSDYFNPQYYRRGEIHDPQGPPTGTQRVVRGGSWNDSEEDLRVARRLGVPPSTRSSQIGFRIVRELPNDRKRYSTN